MPTLSLYQAFCVIFYLSRGDNAAALRCLHYPREWFAFGDAVMLAAMDARNR